MSHRPARLTTGRTTGLASTLTAAVTCAVVATGAVVTGAVATPASAAPAGPSVQRDIAPDPTAAVAAADWLADHLDGGLLQYSSFDAANYGASIDAARSMAANDLQPATVQTISDAVAANIGDYITGEAFGDVGSTYAGPTAKAIRMAQAAGDDPRAYGGLDLVARLEGRVSTAPTSTGRISDQSMYGDNANTIGQAFASSALFVADSAQADEATAYLLLQQCAAGFFRLALGATSVDTCDAAAGSPSVDVTATAVMELQEQRETPAVAGAITRANDWLAGVQRADGAFGSDGDIPTGNANSTGLAAAALGVSGRGALAAKAAVWLRQRQLVGAGACQPFKVVDRGALAYDQSAYDAVRAGDATTATDQFTVATAQALAGLAFAPGGNPSVNSTSRATVRSGSTITVRLANAPAGSPVCTSTFGSQQLKLVGTDGKAGFRVSLATKPAVRTVRVAGPDYVRTLTRRVLGAARLKVVPGRPEVVAGGRQTIRVRGLAPGESVHVSFRGMPVGRGAANAGGVFTDSFKVYRKVGKFTVVVTGLFPTIRRGVASFRVTR